MHHTYILKTNRSINPANSQPRIVRVQEPRSLEMDGMKLQLRDSEPDLPVGTEVKVWRDTRFRCESVGLIGQKAVSAEKREAGVDHPNPQEQSYLKYVLTTQALLDRTTKPSVLRSHMESLRAKRGKYDQQYKKFKKSKALTNQQKAADALAFMSSIDEAMVLVSRYVVERLTDQGIPGGAAYAYGPGEGIHYDVHTPGRDHFQLALPLVRGRLVRQLGDVLCKPSRQFWGLRITDDPKRISCWACFKRMVSLLD